MAIFQHSLTAAITFQVLAAIVSYTVTSSYVEEHYGEVPTTKQDADWVIEDWFIFGSHIVWVVVLRPWWDIYLSLAAAFSLKKNANWLGPMYLQLVFLAASAFFFVCNTFELFH